MQRILRTVAPAVALLALTACADSMYQQPYAVQQPPTLTQMQGQCFSKFQQFSAQAICINNAIIMTGIAPDAGIQEYLLLTKSLQEKVNRKTISENDARLKLAGKLSELKTIQNNEDAMQQQLENQRIAHNAEVLRQYQADMQRTKEMYPTYAPVQSTPLIVNPAPQYQTRPVQAYQLPKPMVTECRGVRNQVLCTTQ